MQNDPSSVKKQIVGADAYIRPRDDVLNRPYEGDLRDDVGIVPYSG